METQNLSSLLNSINDNRKSVVLTIYNNYHDLIHTAQGSTIKHQAWSGGYADHIYWCLRINNLTYTALNDHLEELPFKKDSATIVLFFHDIEKIFKYGDTKHNDVKKWHQLYNHLKCWDKVKWCILTEMQERYGFSFTQDELNALKYTHGEGDDYSPTANIASPLAAHVHHCDNASARIYANFGQASA